MKLGNKNRLEAQRPDQSARIRMLTIFAVPKPFKGHIGTIQRNAIRSWTQLSPHCQVILCGDETGCRETALEFSVEYVGDIERNEFGTPLLSSVFQRAEEHAVHGFLCYVNADLILFADFVKAVRRVTEIERRFLLVGRTLDVDVQEELTDRGDNWEVDLRRRAAELGTPRPADAIDFFVFTRDAIGLLPPFAVGRPSWDNWMIYRALSRRVPVIDISSSTLVIHQSHGYEHVKQQRGDRWEGPEGDRNRALLGVYRRNLLSLDDATYRLTPTGLVRIPAGNLKRRMRTAYLVSPMVPRALQVLRPAYRAMRSLQQAVALRMSSG